MNRQIPWPRILIEGVVIGGSILLAFGPQAQIRRNLALGVRCDHIAL